MPADGPYGITVGVQGNPVPLYRYWANLLPDLANLGCTWLRFQMGWQRIQLHQSDPASSWSWGVLDDAIARCNAAGINLCLTVRDPPDWAFTNPVQKATNESGTSSNSPLGDGWYLPDPTMTANFAGAMALRYNGVTPNPTTGKPYGFVAAIEIGNELFNIHFTPNATPAWKGLYNSPYALYNAVGGVTSANRAQPARDPHFFSPVLKACYPQIKAASPQTLVVMGSIWWLQPPVSSGSLTTTISNMTAFLRGMYADGCKGSFDVANFHYYSNTTDPATGSFFVTPLTQAIADISSVLTANGETHKPVWLTEFSWQQMLVNTTSSTAVASAGSRTITLGSTANIFATTTALDIDSGANQETVTPTIVSGNTITAVFANAHAGTYAVVSASGDTAIDGSTGQTDNCVSRLSFALEAARTSGVVTKVFYYTLNYVPTTGTTLNSLVQWGYNQGTPSSYVQMPIYLTLKSYSASNPSWGTVNNITRVRDVGTRLNLKSATTIHARDIGARFNLSTGTVVHARDVSTRFNLSRGTAIHARDINTRFVLISNDVVTPTFSVLPLTDSLAQAVQDYITTFTSQESPQVQSLFSLLSSVAGAGAGQTMGRLLGTTADPLLRTLLLQAGEQTSLGLTSLFARMTTPLPFYRQFYPLLNGLDDATGDLALYLADYANFQGIGSGGVVNANFAALFNAFAVEAVILGYRDGPDTLPDLIPNWLIFPSADVDPLYTWTCGDGNTILYQAQGTTMAPFGGGTAPLYLYKTNAKGAVGGATFTVTYQTGQGTIASGEYATIPSLGGHGSLSSGSVQLPFAGSSILSVSGTGMTAGEQYAIGAKLVRASAY